MQAVIFYVLGITIIILGILLFAMLFASVARFVSVEINAAIEETKKIKKNLDDDKMR